jgi:hypothetical protein
VDNTLAMASIDRLMLHKHSQKADPFPADGCEAYRDHVDRRATTGHPVAAPGSGSNPLIGDVYGRVELIVKYMAPTPAGDTS